MTCSYLIRGHVCNHLSHELQELFPPFELRDRRFNLAGRHLWRRKQIERPVPLVGALIGPHNLAVVCFHAAGLSFQRLAAGFLIHRNDQPFLRRTQTKPDQKHSL